jgi:hypothetical protein
MQKALSHFEGCTDREKDALADDFRKLNEHSRKLETGSVCLSVFGEINTGKSSLINALLGRCVAEVSIEGGATRSCSEWVLKDQAYSVPGFEESRVFITDTPGINEVDGATRARIAREVAEFSDLILFVVDSDVNHLEHQALVQLKELDKPILVIVNQMDKYSTAQQQELLQLLKTDRFEGLIPPENILSASADPMEREYLIEGPDGSTRSRMRKPDPNVEELKIRILEILHQDGKSLIALNAALFASDKSDRIHALRIRYREDQSQKVVWSYAVGKSVGVALNPIPIADVVGGSFVDVGLILNLGAIYGCEITRQNARTIIKTILQSAGWVAAADVISRIAFPALKGLTLGMGTLLTALPQGAIAGYTAYIVGQAAKSYFEQGASWSEEGPKAVVARILETTDKASIIDKLKEEIQRKIQKNKYSSDREQKSRLRID